MFKPSLPPLSLTKTKILSETELFKEFEINCDSNTETVPPPKEIDPIPAIPKIFKKPLLSHSECSFKCCIDFCFLFISVDIQVI